MSVRFNGVDIPSFVLVKNIKTSILPPVSQNTVKIRGRAGSYDYGNTLGDREITLDIVIEASTPAELRSRVRELATWMYYEEPKELILLDEPDKYYMAKVTGDTDLSQMLSVGEGSISFICTDPYAYSVNETVVDFNPTDDTPVPVINNGNTSTFPKFEFTFTQDSTEFGIASDDQFIYFGTPPLVELPPPQVKSVTILDDPCDSIVGWTTGSGVDNGIVTGTIESSGTFIRQSGLNYGSGPAWHGAAVVKMFPNGKQIQDFTIDVEAGFNPAKNQMVGRLEVYLLDANGNRIGKIAIKNTDTRYENPYIEARAGTAQSGKTFVNTNVKRGYYVDFLGLLRIQRIGKVWKILVGKRNSKNQLYNVYTAQYVDTSNQYNTKVAGIQLHFGAYASYSAVLSNYVTNIKVVEENVVIQPDAPPIIFKAGDVLEVDCSTGTILKNGEPFYSELNLASTFISLKPGTNGISIAPQITTNGKITYRERWL